MKSMLAILGGAPVRKEPWPAWPRHGAAVHEAIVQVKQDHPSFGARRVAQWL